MKTLDRVQMLFFTLAMVSLLMGIVQSVFAQTFGQPAEGTFLTCSSKEEAIKALTVLRDEGEESFVQKFPTFDCNAVEGKGIVKGIVGTVKVDDKTYKVVEMDFGDLTLYWMTSQVIKGMREV